MMTGELAANSPIFLTVIPAKAGMTTFFKFKIMIYPIVEEINYQEPHTAFAQFSGENGAVLLDSSQLMPGCGRYSFIAVDPFLIITSKKNEVSLDKKKIIGNPWKILAAELAKYSFQKHANLPPFQGGVAGFFSYDLLHHLENIPFASSDDMQFPDIALGFYDVVIAFDQQQKRAWIFSSGFPEKTTSSRMQRAKSRIYSIKHFCVKREVIPKKKTLLSLLSNFTPAEYCNAVEKVRDYILAGDIFEANISQRFSADFYGDPYLLYSHLRQQNPAPFSAFVSFGDAQLVSASPERFLKLNESRVESRPIKGTRPRGKTPLEDKANAETLLQSEKDHAENIMIVDLLRNDLSRVCEPHSVLVPQLCGLETYASVHHLVSVITGTLKNNYTALDLLQTAFPGGSITGAPKIRAMEIIAEIEPTARGPYCGSIGYIGFDGAMDCSVSIRTYAVKDNRITFQAGGAVTLDSEPEQEYEETLTKAQALQKVLYDFVS